MSDTIGNNAAGQSNTPLYTEKVVIPTKKRFHMYHSTIPGQRFTFPDGQEVTFFGGFLEVAEDLMFTPRDKEGKEMDTKPCHTELDKIIGKQPHITKIIDGKFSGTLEVLPSVKQQETTERMVAEGDHSMRAGGANIQVQEDLSEGPDKDLQDAMRKAGKIAESDAELATASLTQSPAAQRAAEKIAAINADRASRLTNIERPA